MIWESFSDRRLSTNFRTTVNMTFFAWWDALTYDARNANARRFGQIFTFAMAEADKAQSTRTL